MLQIPFAERLALILFGLIVVCLLCKSKELQDFNNCIGDFFFLANILTSVYKRVFCLFSDMAFSCNCFGIVLHACFYFVVIHS